MSKKKLLIILTQRGRKHLYISALIIVFASIFGSTAAYNLIQAKTYKACIVIDPGHGGQFTGVTDDRLFEEKNINLQLAWKLREELDGMNITTEMTRETDTALNKDDSRKDMEARTDIFNSGKFDLFVSLHVMRTTSENDRGCIVLYSPRNDRSLYLAECVQNRLNSQYQKEWKMDLKRKPIASGYSLLKNANIPGILIESGFMSNPLEKQRLMEPDYQTIIAKAIARGIRDYLSKTRSLPETPVPAGNPNEEIMPFNETIDYKIVKAFILNT